MWFVMLECTRGGWGVDAVGRRREEGLLREGKGGRESTGGLVEGRKRETGA